MQIWSVLDGFPGVFRGQLAFLGGFNLENGFPPINAYLSTVRKKLPIGIQDFEKLREGDFLYVDKTELIHRLVSSGQYFFVSRPRRFGKSLLVSTLRDLFLGKKHLFKNLWIEDKFQWESTPVLHIDFSLISSKEVSLADSFQWYFDRLARELEIDLPKGSVKQRFADLIQIMGKEKKVAILIDEYDKPVVDFIEDLEQAQKNKEFIREFYSVIKGSDRYIKFFFLTGVSKFSKVSIFSDLNQIEDISFNPHYAQLFGYTEKELGFYFFEWIEELGNKYANVYPSIYQAIKEWYNGYSWDGEKFVYNPFSILNLLSNQIFRDYWFQTGTPKFLIQQFRANSYFPGDFENLTAHFSLLGSFDIDHLDFNTLLLQTGYLTIKRTDPQGQILYLGFPNREVESSFFLHLIAELTRGSSQPTNYIHNIEQALLRGEVDSMMKIFTSFFANLAYPVLPNQSDPLRTRELYYHSIFFTVIKLLSLNIELEVPTNKGRIDAVIKTQERIFIIELKMGTGEEAMEQIKANGYHEKYLLEGKRIVLLGIGFDADSRNINNYQVEEIEA